MGAHLDGLIVQVGGAIRDIRTFVPRRSTTGQRMAALQIEDLTGSVEVVVFARVFEECANALRPDAVIVVRGKVEAGRGANVSASAPIVEDEDRVDLEPPQILAEAVYAYDDPRLAAWRRDSTVHISVSAAQIAVLGALRHAFEEHQGDCPVVLHVDSGTSVDEITLASTSRWSRVRRSNVPWSMWSGTVRTASRCTGCARRNASARQLGADGAGAAQIEPSSNPKTNLITMIRTMYMTSAAIAG